MKYLGKSIFFLFFTALILFIETGCNRIFNDWPDTIVLITIETLRPDHLSCYDYVLNTSPNIDKFAKDGIIYRNSFATASATAPSIASILTSRYPSQHGVTEYFLTKLSDSETTIAELLSKKDYTCAAFIGNPVITRERNLGQGFDIYNDELPQFELNRHAPERIADPLTDAAIQWLQSTSGRRFLWLHYQDPHGPYFPPKDWRKSFTPGDSGLEKLTLPLLKDNGGYGGIPDYQKLFDHRDVGYYLAMYDSEIKYMDNAIGHFLDFLKEKQLYRKSIIFLTADHGEAFGENNYYFAHGHKSTPDQTKVPLIVKLPDQRVKEKIVHKPVSTLDIFSSILFIVEYELPENIEGVCLPEFIGYKKQKRILFSETQFHYALISDDYYYTKDKPGFKKAFINPISGGPIYPMDPLLYDIKEAGLVLNKEIKKVNGILNEMDDALSAFYKACHTISQGNIPEEKKRILKSLGYLQ